MANVIEYAKLFQSELDVHMTAKATSGWMEVNSDLVQYKGGNEIKIASIIMDGLADYSRSEGFPGGSVNLSFETHRFTQDRARTFSIDRMDVDESNFVLTAANLMAIFQQDYVVPEVDAYRYSKIAEIALDGGKCVSGAPLTPAEIFDLLTDDIGLVQDIIGEERDLVITMSVKTSKILNANDKITKRLDVTDFKRGEITTKVQSLDGVPIITVPSARFWSEYTFKTGGTGQEAGGFEKTPDAVPIQWIITAKQAPIAVSKTEAVRIFEPENNPKADAWKVDYRKYHDLWIPQNKLDGVLVRLEQEEDGE